MSSTSSIVTVLVLVPLVVGLVRTLFLGDSSSSGASSTVIVGCGGDILRDVALNVKPGNLEAAGAGFGSGDLRRELRRRGGTSSAVACILLSLSFSRSGGGLDRLAPLQA